MPSRPHSLVIRPLGDFFIGMLTLEPRRCEFRHTFSPLLRAWHRCFGLLLKLWVPWLSSKWSSAGWKQLKQLLEEGLAGLRYGIRCLLAVLAVWRLQGSPYDIL